MPEGIARLIKIAVALKDVGGSGEPGEFRTVQVLSFFGGEEQKPSAARRIGRGHVLSKGELAEVLLSISQSGDGARNTGSLIADQRQIGNHIAFGIEVHVAAGSGWRITV